MARLLEHYKKEVVSKLKEEFGYTNVHQIPKMTKIVLNMGVGEALNDKQNMEMALREMTMIAGQKAQIRASRKSISNFNKLRKGVPIGCKVTLRGERMYEFFDRLVSVVIPRIRDFRGLSRTSFDRSGNYSFGVTEQTIFPEVDLDKVKRVQGMDITFVTSAGNKEEAESLLRAMGLPLKKAEDKGKKQKS